MNTKIKLALLAGQYQEKGFTTALALGLGLVAVAVGLTMVAKGQANQNSAVAQTKTTQVSAIAEGMVTRTQSTFLSFPELARKNFPSTNSSDSWTTIATAKDVTYTDACGAPATGTLTYTQRLNQLIPTTNEGYITLGDGKAKILQYTYNGTDKGTLLVEAIGNKGGKRKIQVSIPLIPIDAIGTITKPPGLWVKTFAGVGDKKIGETNQKVNADVVTQGCNTVGFDSTNNFAAATPSWKVSAKPELKFPDLPALPAFVKTKGVTNLANCASSLTANNSLPIDEANWFASIYQQLQNIVIAPANAATTTAAQKEATINLTAEASKTYTVNIDVLTGNTGYAVNTVKNSAGTGNPKTFNTTYGKVTISGNNLVYTYISGSPVTTTNLTETFSYQLKQGTGSNANYLNGSIKITINKPELVIIPPITPPAINYTETINVVKDASPTSTTTYSIATLNKIETVVASTTATKTLTKVGLKNLTYALGNADLTTDTFTYTYKDGNTTKTASVLINILASGTDLSTVTNNNPQTNYTLPGFCTGSNYYNSATDTFDYLVSSLDVDNLTIALPNGQGKAVRIFVQNNIDIRGNSGISSQPNQLQIYGSNAAGLNNTTPVNYAATGDNTQYTVTEVLTRGGANIYAFLYAPAAKAGVNGGGNSGGFYGTMWVNNWAGPNFGSSSNKIVIDPPAGTNWDLLPGELKQAIITLQGGGVKAGFEDYKVITY